jgi:hypothetical protein
LPLCSSTTIIRKKQTIMWTTVSNMIMISAIHLAQFAELSVLYLHGNKVYGSGRGIRTTPSG